MDLIPNASNIAIQTLLHTLHSNFSLVPFGALLVYLASLLSTLWRQRSGLTVEQRRQIVQTVIVPRKSSVWTFLSVQLFKQLYTTRRPKMCLDDLIQEVAAGNGELRTPVDHISNLLANQTLRLACDVSIQLTVGNQLVSQLITWRLQGILPTFTHPRLPVTLIDLRASSLKSDAAAEPSWINQPSLSKILCRPKHRRTTHLSYTFDTLLKTQSSVVVISLDATHSHQLQDVIGTLHTALTQYEEPGVVIALEITLFCTQISMLDPTNSTMLILPFMQAESEFTSLLGSSALLSVAEMLSKLTAGSHPFKLLGIRDLSKDRVEYLASLVRDLAHSKPGDRNHLSEIFYRQWEIALYEQQKIARWSFLVSL